MTKAEFDAKFDKCYLSYINSVADKSSLLKRLDELLGDKEHVSNAELCMACLLCSFELSADFLHSALTEVFEFDD